MISINARSYDCGPPLGEKTGSGVTRQLSSNSRIGGQQVERHGQWGSSVRLEHHRRRKRIKKPIFDLRTTVFDEPFVQVLFHFRLVVSMIYRGSTLDLPTGSTPRYSLEGDPGRPMAVRVLSTWPYQKRRMAGRLNPHLTRRRSFFRSFDGRDGHQRYQRRFHHEGPIALDWARPSRQDDSHSS